MIQPKATDFTTVMASFTQDGEYNVMVDIGTPGPTTRHTVARFGNRDEAEKAELAINQAMIEYHIKRNEWEDDMSGPIMDPNGPIVQVDQEHPIG